VRALAQANRQTLQLAEELPQEIVRGLISQTAIIIELHLRVGNVYMWRIHRDHIERHAYMTKMKLSARGT